jgi:transposase
MSHRTFHLTPAEIAELQAAYQHCPHARTKIRFQAVRLYGTGYSTEQIQDICSCVRSSLREWVTAYRDRGIAALVDHRCGGNRARLTPAQIVAVQQQVHTYTPAQLLGKDACVGEGTFWTVESLALLLERDYEVVYASPTSYRTLLHRCGLSYQRPAKQYKSHNQEKVRDFEERLEKKSWTSSKTLPTP